MLEVTDRAHTELQRLLRANLTRPHQAVRLRVDGAGSLNMTIDVPHAGDTIVRRELDAMLIVDGRLSPALAGRVLDFRAADGASKNEFTLLPKPTSAVEPDPVAEMVGP